ncbi:MAG: 4Fe-4S dicluster domain-containing protein [Candidatus Eremiobacteraeota bacterium]|nr:4Fe-4S dicluster domain-containing protein [Candidatus Eremiobacteraeota bacterium]
MDKSAKLQETARRLLTEGKVRSVVACRKGRLPFYLQPAVITDPSKAGKAVFTPLAGQNLVKIAEKAEKPAAVAVKGCDVGSLVDLFQEHQIKRSDIFIIGMACPGVLKEDALEKDGRFKISAVTDVREEKGRIMAVTSSGAFEMPASLLMEKCLTCKVHTPAMYDELIGDDQAPAGGAPGQVKSSDLHSMTPGERRDFWLRMFSRCIRCNACRQACPLCYCNECVMDESMPRWVTAENNAVENLFHQMIRALHSAGRCTGCRECERVCPVGIPLSLLYDRIADEAKELFGHEAGIDPESRPALLAYLMNDPGRESCLGGKE